MRHPQTAIARVAIEVTIDLSGGPKAMAALTDLLGTLAERSGTSVTILDHPAARIPHPRRSTEDIPTGELRIAPHSRVVLRHGTPVELTRLEFDLLLYLSRRPRQVLQRSVLMAEVWGVTAALGSRTVDVHIRRLRDKLGPDCAAITTVRGVGYRFDGTVVVEEPADQTGSVHGPAVQP